MKGSKLINNPGKAIAVGVGGLIVGTATVYFTRKGASHLWNYFERKVVEYQSKKQRITPTTQSVQEAHAGSKYANLADGQLLGKLIYSGDIAIVYGEFGTGKSTLALQIAEDIATGKRSQILLEEDDQGLHKPQEVLYYDGEMDATDYNKIYGDYDVSSIKNITLIRGFYFPSPKEWLEDLENRLATVKTNVTVFLDNLSCLTSAISGNVIREFFLNDLKRIQQDYSKQGVEVTFVFMAHTNKEGELAGSQNISNFGTNVIGLFKSENKDFIYMQTTKNRKYGDMARKIFLLQKKQTEDGRMYMANMGEAKKSTTKEDDDEGKSFYALHKEGKTDLEIAEMVGYSRETVNRKRKAYEKKLG